ncbi:6-cysteine protein [Plasmodium chabaudi chabaudi]|uniref:6-cysteine protein n=1 Tax=Plasmodium chabaudi chabaudi TaxID=31271 RepID=A0A1C6XD91_PLACU|nr:6-cysteine protein [Plasmodium chabaudi chabaudi]
MKDHIKNLCFRKTLLITLLLVVLKYTKYDYLEKENGEKPKYNSDISPPSLIRTYFDVYVNRKNKGVKELKKLLKNVMISNDYLCTVKKVDINVYNKICGNKVSKIILNNEKKYGEIDLKKKCISTRSSSCTFGEEKKREKLFTDYEKRNLYKTNNLLEDIDGNGNTNKNFLFELFDIIAKIKKIIIDASNKIISMCLFNTGNHEKNLFCIKNNKDYDELHNSNFYNYYENPNVNAYNINKELYEYSEEYANKYLYSFIDISSDDLNIHFYQKAIQGEDENIALGIFKNKNVHNSSKDKKYDSHSKMDDGNKSNWGFSNDNTEKYIFETETNRNINFKTGQFLKVLSDYFGEKSEKWNESKINQSNKLHKKNDEMIHRLIGRVLAEHEYENLSLAPDGERERERERERGRERERDNERSTEVHWEKKSDKNKDKYRDGEEKFVLIIREQNGNPRSDGSDRGNGLTVLEFSHLPPKKRRRTCTILAETESENSSKANNNNNDSKPSDNKNNSSDESSDKSKDYSPASPTPDDITRGKTNRLPTIIEGKELENERIGNKNNSSDEISDKSKYYSPASPTPGDTAENKTNRPSIIIEGKEHEHTSSDNKNNSSDESSDKSKDYSPASPTPGDTPEGKIERPCRLIAEKESEDKSSDSKTNSSDNNNNDESKYDNPASPPPSDASKDKIERPSRLIAEKESEDKSEDKSENKSENESKNKSDDGSKEYDPASPPAEDIPEGKIERPSRLIAEKESEDKSSDSKTNSSDNKNNDGSKYENPASPPPSDIPEGKIERPSRLIAEKESEDKSSDSKTNSSDNKNNDGSKYENPASPPPSDIPEGKIERPSRLIAEKESEDKSENKSEDKSENKNEDGSKEYDPASPPAEDIPEEKESEDKNSDSKTNSSDNNDDSKYDNPASPPPSDIPEGKIERSSRLIAEKESEDKNSDSKTNSSDDNNNTDDSKYDNPASPPPSDIPEGKIERPSRLIAEKESEYKSEDKSSDSKTNSSDNNNNNNDDSKYDNPASPPPNDVSKDKINRKSRLIAEQELEDKENVKYIKKYKPYNPPSKDIDISKYYTPNSPSPSDTPEDKIKRPSRLIAEKESEDKSENKGENNSEDKSENKNDDKSENKNDDKNENKNDDGSKEYDPASPPAEDIPEGKIERPSRLIAEKESEDKSEEKSENKSEEKSENKNDDESKGENPSSPPAEDIPEGKIERSSRLIAEKESEDKSENKSEDKSENKNNDESKGENPSSPPAEDIPEGKIERPSRLIAEKEFEYKDNEQGKEQTPQKNEINTSQNESHNNMIVENGQKGNGNEEKKSMFDKIKKKKEKYRKKYYAYDIIEAMEALSSLSDEESDMNDSAANRAKTSSILGKYLRQPNISNKYLDINLFFDEKQYRYRKGNYYFINPFPYSIIKMKKNEELDYSEKIQYDAVYCYSLSFNNNSSLAYTIENSFRNVKPIEEIVPGTLTGFKSDDGYQKLLTPMFVEDDMFLHCAFNNEPNEMENRIASFPVKIFLKKNLNKTKGCSFQINKHDSIYKEYAERESFLSKKIILNDENSSNECDITATNEIIGFQCGPPYKHYTNSSNTSYMDKIFFNHVNNEDIKAGEYFKVEPAHCFEEVNENKHIENVAPGSFPFPNFEMINGGLKSHHTRYIKLNIRDPNTVISCYCNYYNNGKIIYSGIMTINGKKKFNDQSDSTYSAQDINKTNDNAKRTGYKKNNSNEKNKIDNMENYNDYKYFLNLLPYYNPYFKLYRKRPEDVTKNDSIYDSKHSNKNNEEFLKKIKNDLANLKFSDNNKYIHGTDDNLRYKYDNRHPSSYPISEYGSESHFDSERLSDSYGDTFIDDYISPHSSSYYGENTYNSDDIFSNYDDFNIESEYEELEPLHDNVTFQDNKSYEDNTQSVIVINKSKNVNVYIPKNKIKNKSKYIKDNEDIEDKKTKDALLKYLLLTYEETPDKNEKLNTKLKLFKEYFPSSPKNNTFIEEKENDHTSNKIKSTSDIKEKSIEPLNKKKINGKIEVSENDSTLDHNKSYNHDNANSNNHERGITDGKVNENALIVIMNKILHELFGHNDHNGNKEKNPKKDKKIHQTKLNTIENEEEENEDDEEEDLIEKTDELTEDENISHRIK